MSLCWSNFVSTFKQLGLLTFLFYRPGILKDLKTMGSISLFIFFVTLLVLGRQVRCSVLSICISGCTASLPHSQRCFRFSDKHLCSFLPHTLSKESQKHLKSYHFLYCLSSMSLKLTSNSAIAVIETVGIMLIVHCDYCLSCWPILSHCFPACSHLSTSICCLPSCLITSYFLHSYYHLRQTQKQCSMHTAV